MKSYIDSENCRNLVTVLVDDSLDQINVSESQIKRVRVLMIFVDPFLPS